MAVDAGGSDAAPRRRRRWLTIAARWLRPGVLAIGVLFFALPFLTVSCETPGGFGHVSAGGTTTWSGFVLATGGTPTRTAEHVLPESQSANDLLGVQPLVLLALLLVVAAVVCALVIVQPQTRRYVTIALAALASVALTAGLVVARHQVVGLVADQLQQPGRTIPPDRTPASYVSIGHGFVLIMATLWLVILVDLGWWIRGRRRRR